MKIEKDGSGYNFKNPKNKVGQISQKYEKLKLKREYIIRIFPFSEKKKRLKFPKEIEIFSPRLESSGVFFFFFGNLPNLGFYFQKMKQKTQTYTHTQNL
jgi:hypothetical protein